MCRIIATDSQLAGASCQAITDPALQRRVIVGQGALGEIKGVAVCDAIAHVYFTAAGSDGEATNESDKAHTAAYEIVDERALKRLSFLTFFTFINDLHTV